MIQPAHRASTITEYYFSSKLRQLHALRLAGKPVINLGIGSPDGAPDSAVVQVLQKGVADAGAHGYQPYQGLPAFQEAIIQFHLRHYGVKLDSVLPLMGSKEGITHISLAYLNPGDQVLIPSLGYPTYTSVTQMVGAQPIFYQLEETKDWQPDWNFLDQLDTNKVKMMWINYPHMPTGAMANRDLLARLVNYCRDRDILLCHDNPYSFLLNPEPMSIFQMEGADEIALELNSMSKTFNMAGWRVGWISGAKELLEPVLKIKSNMDSGMFRPIQEAAMEALKLSDQWFDKLNHTYAARQALAFQILTELGCTYRTPQAGMFVWGKTTGESGEELSDRLLSTADVFITPGFIFGDQGKDYIRISLCSPVETLQEVLGRIQKAKS